MTPMEQNKLLAADVVRVAARAAVGTISAPPSKSISHRMLICAALADGCSTLRGLSLSEDILATMDVLQGLGARFEPLSEPSSEGECVRVQGVGGVVRDSAAELYCRESGSTLRFVIPLCLLSPSARVLRGSERLLARPLDAYQNLFASRWGGCETTKTHGGALTLHSGNVLGGGKYQLRGDVSSQFISGLLFALPLCEQDSRIELTSMPESRPYIDLTLDALRSFGVRVIRESETVFYIPGGQRYCPYDGRVEGDASGAAFFGALNALGGAVEVTGLRRDSLQGDRIYDVLFDRLVAPRAAGAPLPCIDLADCPDLAPILFAVAAEHGGAVFTHTDRLRLKECDRIAAMQAELAKFGARIEATDGAQSPNAAACGGMVRVLPTPLHAPIEPLDSHNDHRIVMSLAVLATKYGGTIRGAQAVKKSFPDFFARLASLGADVMEIEETAAARDVAT